MVEPTEGLTPTQRPAAVPSTHRSQKCCCGKAECKEIKDLIDLHAPKDHVWGAIPFRFQVARHHWSQAVLNSCHKYRADLITLEHAKAFDITDGGHSRHQDPVNKVENIFRRLNRPIPLAELMKGNHNKYVQAPVQDLNAAREVALGFTEDQSSNDQNDRKRKPTRSIPDTVTSNNGRNNPEEESNKARRVSTTNALTASTVITTSASASTSASIQVAKNIPGTQQEDSIESIGQMILDLFPFGNAKVNAALDALNLDLKDDKEKCYKIQVLVGCLPLVLLLKRCFDNAIREAPACYKVIELNEVAELTSIHKALHIMIRLTHHLDESQVGIVAIGGVEAVVKVMKAFPKCQALQEFACILLHNLACCCVGKKRVRETAGMEVLLAAVNNHMGTASICDRACLLLINIVSGSKENIGILINLGGATTVAKVRNKWRNNDLVQTRVRKLANLIASEMKAWADE